MHWCFAEQCLPWIKDFTGSQVLPARSCTKSCGGARPRQVTQSGQRDFHCRGSHSQHYKLGGVGWQRLAAAHGWSGNHSVGGWAIVQHFFGFPFFLLLCCLFSLLCFVIVYFSYLIVISTILLRVLPFFPLILLPFSWARGGVSKLWWLDDWLGLVKPQYCFKSSLIPKCLTWATVAVLNCSLGPISLVKDFPDVGTGTQRWKGGTGLGKKCSLGLLDGRVWLLWWEMPLCSVVTCCHSVTRLLQWQIAPQLLRDHHGWMNNILELANLFEGAFVVP